MNAKPLTLENCTHVSAEITAIALAFYEGGSGLERPLNWVDDGSRVEDLVRQSGLRNPFGDEPTLDLQQKAYVKTKGGETYFFHIAEAEPGIPGIIVLAGGHCITGVDFHNTVLRAFEVEYWNPREESSAAKATDDGYQEDMDELSELLAGNARRIETAKGKVSEGTIWRVVFWGDKEGSTSNKDFGEWFETAHTHSIALQALGMGNIVDCLDALTNGGDKIGQIIMSVHGTYGSFRVDKPSKPFYGPAVCGLYKDQVTPSTYATEVKPYMNDDATITLLSCKTAGTKDAIDGKTLMKNISSPLSSYMISSDEDVYMTVDDPYTYGNIYRSTPSAAQPVVYIVGGAKHSMPIAMF